jgi:SAM-dependent methyltransferase
VGEDVVRFFEAHPGTGINDLRAAVTALNAPTYQAYDAARRQVAELVDAGVLEICGEVPLESVDLRFERVARCDVCGQASATHPIVFWKYGTPVVRCASCGLLYANPRWKAEHLFGRYTSEYWSHYSETVHGSADAHHSATVRQTYYLAAFERELGQPGRLLDVGCATGEFLALAGRRGWRVAGVESSPAAAEAARAASGADVHAGTLDTAPFSDASFDAITLFEVIEHLQSPRTYVETIARLLRPGGVFALSTPNIRSVAYWLLGRDWSAIGPNDHLFYFSPSTLTRLLRAHGFSILELRSERTNAAVWKEALPAGASEAVAETLARWTAPLVARLRVGDGLYAIARRT